MSQPGTRPPLASIISVHCWAREKEVTQWETDQLFRRLSQTLSVFKTSSRYKLSKDAKEAVFDVLVVPQNIKDVLWSRSWPRGVRKAET